LLLDRHPRLQRRAMTARAAADRLASGPELLDDVVPVEADLGAESGYYSVDFKWHNDFQHTGWRTTSTTSSSGITPSRLRSPPTPATRPSTIDQTGTSNRATFAGATTPSPRIHA